MGLSAGGSKTRNGREDRRWRQSMLSSKSSWWIWSWERLTFFLGLENMADFLCFVSYCWTMKGSSGCFGPSALVRGPACQTNSTLLLFFNQPTTLIKQVKHILYNGKASLSKASGKPRSLLPPKDTYLSVLVSSPPDRLTGRSNSFFGLDWF